MVEKTLNIGLEETDVITVEHIKNNMYIQKEYNWGKTDYKKFKDYIELKDKIIFDAGCGMGGKTFYYNTFHPKKIIGFDQYKKGIINANNIVKQNNIKHIKFLTGDLSNLPFDNDFFDIIFMSDVTEHITKDKLNTVFNECKRVLKKDGKFCIIFPPWNCYEAGHIYNYIFIPWIHLLFSENDLINFLEKHNVPSSCISQFKMLNRISVDGFLKIVKDLKFRITFFKCIMIKNLDLLNCIPFFNRYFVKRVVVILTK